MKQRVIRLFSVFFLFIVIALQIRAQESGTSSVYGIIVGVSKYSDPSFKPLNYADDDALWFYSFLKSQIVKPADHSKIKLFRNDSARADLIWAEIFKIRKKANPGDTVYFYFSGHGDAGNPENIMLISHNAINGLLQAGGCIPMRDLKDEFKILNAKKVKVILITDACRANEEADELNNLIFTNKIANQSSGEFQFISCSSDEKSYEDARWGGGHGVFTFHLIEGWLGLADKDDGEVSLGELVTYVKEQVKKDTYDSKKKKSLQKPHHCCSDQEDWIVGKVDEEIKKKILIQKEMGNNMYAALMPNMRSKNANLSSISDTSILRMYQKFYNALDDKRFLYPDTNCAYTYYVRLKNSGKAESILSDVEIDLVAGMANEAQSAIQDFLTSKDTLHSTSFFRNAAALMNASLGLMDTTDQLYKNMKARALFLEAGSLMDSQDKMVQAFYKLDSSLVFEPGAPYVFYMRAKIYEEFKYYKEAEENYLKAIELAPKWVNPLIGLAYFYNDNGKLEKSLQYYEEALKIQPTPHTFNLIAYAYYSGGQYEKAIETYQKALDKDPNDINALNGMGAALVKVNQQDSAIVYYLKALSLDSFYYYTYAHIGAYYYENSQYNRAEECYDFATQLNPSYKHGFYMLGEICELKKDPYNAVKNYLACLQIDRYDSYVYYKIGSLLAAEKMYREALNYYITPTFYDDYYNPVYVGETYLELGVLDSAYMWLKYSDENFPDQYRTQSLIGLFWMKREDYASALPAFHKSSELKPDYEYNYFSLAISHYYLTNIDSAIYYYEKTITLNPSYLEVYPYLWSIYMYEKTDYPKALDVLNRGLKEFPENEDLLYYKAFHYLLTGESEKALVESEKTIRLNPDNGRNYFGKAMILASLNRENESIEMLEKAIKTGLKITHEDLEVEYFNIIRTDKRFKKLVNNIQKSK